MTVARRAAHRLIGRPRNRWASWKLMQIDGGDELELAVDHERGVVLRSAARLEGEEFRVVEVVDIAFDEEFGPETFRPVAGAPKEERVEAREVSPEEAAELASFALWLPPLPREGWNMRIVYFPGDENEPEAVWLEFVRRQGTHQLTISLNPAGARGDWLDHRREWEAVERAGHEVHVLPARERYGMQAAVRLERDGTRITLMSESLRHESLLEIADSLAQYEPPATEP